VTEESALLHAFRASFEEGQRAWNEGDVKRAYAALPDELEYRLAPQWPESRTLHSRDEVIEFFEDFQEIAPDARAHSAELFEIDDRTIVAGFRVTGSGRRSGAQTEMEIWQVWEMSEPLVASRVTEFTSRGEALEAAGAQQARERQHQ
jgi:ketosteroid isomerase-like protein